MVDRIPPLRVEVGWGGLVATVIVSGGLDISTAPGLIERLGEVAGARPEWLVLDFAGLVFLDVAGARALDGAHKTLATICPVIVLDPLPFARRVAGVTGLIDD
jgi:anti-anti-sigma regulatory factor